MAFSVPVVTTSEGVEGLAAEGGIRSATREISRVDRRVRGCRESATVDRAGGRGGDPLDVPGPRITMTSLHGLRHPSGTAALPPRPGPDRPRKVTAWPKICAGIRIRCGS